MLEHVGVVVGGQKGVDRDRHNACEHRAEESNRPVGAVVHEDHDSLLTLDASVFEPCGETAGALLEPAISERACVVGEGDLVGAPGIGLQKMTGEVEHFRRGWRALTHLSSPPPPVARFELTAWMAGTSPAMTAA